MLAVALIISFSAPAFADSTNGITSVQFFISQNTYFLNASNAGVNMDAAPYIDANSGRTLVPVRYLADALGTQTNWDGTPQTVTVTSGSTTIDMTIGSTTLAVNGNTQTLDQAPVINNGRTCLPARWVANALGYQVDWDAQFQDILIWPNGTQEPPFGLRSPRSSSGQTPLANLTTSIRSLKISDDSPGETWWAPLNQDNAISQVSAWLKTATPYAETIPQSQQVFLMDYLGPSQLHLTTSDNQTIKIYPAYYYTKTEEEQYGTYLAQVQYVQDVIAFDNGQGISYFTSEQLFDWLKTDQWKTEFTIETTAD
jgi:hypothetical protein